jgi:hypothetical protein
LRVSHQVFALLPYPKHTRLDIETDTLTYHKGGFPIYSGCQPEEGGFNPYRQAAYEAEERRLASIRASLDKGRRAARGILPGEAVKELWRPGLFKKTGTLPGGSPVTLNPKGSNGTDSVTAMVREASHPDYDHLFSQNPTPELRRQRELLQQEFWKDNGPGLEVPWERPLKVGNWGRGPVVEPTWRREKLASTPQGGPASYLANSMAGIQSGATGGNLHRSKQLVRLEREAAAEWAATNRRNDRPASPFKPHRRNWEPTHHAGQGDKFDVQAAEEAESQREQSNLARMQAVQRRFAHEAVHNEPQWAGNPEQLLSRRERAVTREEIPALRNVRQRGSSAPDPFPGTSDPEELRGTGLYPSWYPRDEEDDDETPLPGTAAINDLKFHGLKP